ANMRRFSANYTIGYQFLIVGAEAVDMMRTLGIAPLVAGISPLSNCVGPPSRRCDKMQRSAAKIAENRANQRHEEAAMDLRKLKKLIDLVQESGIAELEITEGEEKVKIVKGGGVSVTPAVVMAAPAAAPVLPGPAVAPAGRTVAPAPAAEPEGAARGAGGKGPRGGSLYRSP